MIRRILRATPSMMIAVQLLVGSARALEVDVSDLAVSAGSTYGHTVVLPVGATVTIGARISDSTMSDWDGLAVSYYGYDGSVLGFVEGESVSSIFNAFCLDGSAITVGGLGRVPLGQPPLVEDIAFPGGAFAGTPRVRALVALALEAGTGIGNPPGSPNDPGLDGDCDGGDAHMRLTFVALSDGYTTITIGTGDDRGGIAFGPFVGQVEASNAEVGLAVPEPTPTLALTLGGSLSLALAAARSAGRQGRRRTLGLQERPEPRLPPRLKGPDGPPMRRGVRRPAWSGAREARRPWARPSSGSSSSASRWRSPRPSSAGC